MHLQDLNDSAQAGLQRGRFVYVASIDVDGAFNKVPHSRLLGSLLDTDLDAFLMRCVSVCVWLTGRRLRLRFLSGSGCCLSGWRGITGGLPQGGVSFPFLRLVHFDPIAAILG